ncbi:MAG: Holliday junction resolvase [Clostridiaceae bacterium BRH_c20a]|nr:MAG: Holliday junction resolvase [Clostridiaceae bacterium BRH_c20a]
MRVMGLDIGDRRIGIAVSDPLMITAQSLETLNRTKLEKDISYLCELLEKFEIEELVVGLPKNMNGTLGPQVEKVKEFVEDLLKAKEVKIIYIDERLSTVTVERALISGDVSRKKRKTVVDKLAAAVILQNYLDRLKQ